MSLEDDLYKAVLFFGCKPISNRCDYCGAVLCPWVRHVCSLGAEHTKMLNDLFCGHDNLKTGMKLACYRIANKIRMRIVAVWRAINGEIR